MSPKKRPSRLKSAFLVEISVPGYRQIEVFPTNTSLFVKEVASTSEDFENRPQIVLKLSSNCPQNVLGSSFGRKNWP